MKESTRTTSQNNAYWLFQQMIADEMSYQDKNINNLLEVIVVAPTKNNLHEVFKAMGQVSERFYQRYDS